MTDTQQVKIRYAWDMRRKMIASVIVHWLTPVLRPMLRAHDRLFDFCFRNYKAEGQTDLTLAEYVGVKRCEWRKRHVGRRVSMGSRNPRSPSQHYCNVCQCDWRKFERKRVHRGKGVR